MKNELDYEILVYDICEKEERINTKNNTLLDILDRENKTLKEKIRSLDKNLTEKLDKLKQKNKELLKRHSKLEREYHNGKYGKYRWAEPAYYYNVFNDKFNNLRTEINSEDMGLNYHQKAKLTSMTDSAIKTLEHIDRDFYGGNLFKGI